MVIIKRSLLASGCALALVVGVADPANAAQPAAHHTSMGNMIAATPSSVDAASAATPHCVTWGYREGGLGGPVKFRLRYPALTHARNANGGCLLTRGDSNSGVRTLQEAIERCYGVDLAWDGEYGAATELAVAFVQGKHGIGQDGKYGPQTALTMKFAMFRTDNGQYNGCLTAADFIRIFE